MINDMKTQKQKTGLIDGISQQKKKNMSFINYIKQNEKKGISRNTNINIVSDINNELIDQIQKN